MSSPKPQTLVQSLQSTQPDTDELLEQRGKEYGEAWLVSGEVVAFLNGKGLLDRMLASGYFFAWIIIQVKLIRLLATPGHLDSWKDIEGYAKLASTHINKNSQPHIQH